MRKSLVSQRVALHGHWPRQSGRTLNSEHLWWARRPLAACRAVLFSSLVDDPDSDPQYLKTNGSVATVDSGLRRRDGG